MHTGLASGRLVRVQVLAQLLCVLKTVEATRDRSRVVLFSYCAICEDFICFWNHYFHHPTLFLFLFLTLCEKVKNLEIKINLAGFILLQSPEVFLIFDLLKVAQCGKRCFDGLLF